MAYIYSDRSEPLTGAFDPAKCSATEQYLKHYDNILTLQFFQKNAQNVVEKIQIEKEMSIGRRKLKYWSNQANFDKKNMLVGADKLKAKWEGRL